MGGNGNDSARVVWAAQWAKKLNLKRNEIFMTVVVLLGVDVTGIGGNTADVVDK